jgi:hypothetical protein
MPSLNEAMNQRVQIGIRDIYCLSIVDPHLEELDETRRVQREINRDNNKKKFLLNYSILF